MADILILKEVLQNLLLKGEPEVDYSGYNLQNYLDVCK
jgi:hypothetical protein